MRLSCPLLVLSFALAAACKGDDTVVRINDNLRDSTVHGVAVAPDHATLAQGQTLPLAVQVDAGPGSTDRSVFWSSSDTTVVSVSTAGTVTARSTGTATVTAIANANHTAKATSALTVVPASP